MATISGTPLANRIDGTAYADTIKGLGGNDTLYGRGGNDVIYGSAGNDFIDGGTGDDRLKGGTLRPCCESKNACRFWFTARSRQGWSRFRRGERYERRRSPRSLPGLLDA